MLQIDLVYPQEDATSTQLRDDLRDALRMLGLPPRWKEWDGGIPRERPAYLARASGPMVFLGGQPVSGANGSPGSRARIIMALQEQVSRR